MTREEADCWVARGLAAWVEPCLLASRSGARIRFRPDFPRMHVVPEGHETWTRTTLASIRRVRAALERKGRDPGPVRWRNDPEPFAVDAGRKPRT